MARLLSPNEAKFWLLDWVAPMNSIVVVEREGTGAPEAAPRRFSLPVARIGKQSRPRWGDPDLPGTFETETTEDSVGWLDAAARLQEARVGSEGHPPWRAVVQRHPSGSTLVLALNHALTDWRRSLHVAKSFLADLPAGDLAPACEELLPPSAFGDPQAPDLIDGWWTSRAGARWEGLGLAKLTEALPAAAPTQFAIARLTAAETARLHERCATEGATLNSVLAIALRDVMRLEAVAHAVDMERFIRPAPPPGPGIAVAHVFTPLAGDAFWEAARENRAALFEEIRSGAAGDALLALPRALLGTGEPRYEPAAMTITGAPTVGARDPDAAGDPMQLVLSSARGGGGILILSYFRDRLQLVAGTPGGAPEIPLPAIVARLAEAVA